MRRIRKDITVVRLIAYFIEILLCFLLQSSVFSFFRISGVVPNCFLILVITVAYTKGQIPAIVIGFLSGMILDLSFTENVGFCAILYMGIAFVAGYSNKIYDNRDFITPLGLITLGELLYSFLFFVFRFLLQGKLNIGQYMIYTILPRTLYTLLAGLALYPAFLGIHRLLQKLEGVNND